MLQSSEITAKPAGLLPRLGAALYDGLLLLALFFLATAIIDPFMPADHVPAGAWWFQLYLLLIAFLFYGWFWTHGGQTLGMRAWRLRVVSQDGSPIRWKTALLRFAIAIPSWITLIGLLWCLVDGRSLHDRLSGTRVMRLART
jgi:uncharacterized RDD family membrane protein YckC